MFVAVKILLKDRIEGLTGVVIDSVVEAKDIVSESDLDTEGQKKREA